MRQYLVMLSISIAGCVALSMIVVTIIQKNFLVVEHSIPQGSQPMPPHSQALAYLVAALAFSVPAQQATKYLLQFTKDILPTPKGTVGKSNMTRMYALLFGAVILPVLAASWSYLGYGPGYSLRELPMDAVVGAAAGLAAVLDYHAMQILQAIASGVPFFMQEQPTPEPPAKIIS